MHGVRHYGYRLKNRDGCWSWSVLHPDGSVQRQGEAPTKAIAAACVIRHLMHARPPADLRDTG